MIDADKILYTTEEGGFFKVIVKPEPGEYERIVETGRVVCRGYARPDEPPCIDEPFFYVVALKKVADFDKVIGGPR